MSKNEKSEYLSLENCIKHNGKVYCWDSVKKKIAEITLTYINDSCPSAIVEKMFESRDAKKKADNNESI